MSTFLKWDKVDKLRSERAIGLLQLNVTTASCEAYGPRTLEGEFVRCSLSIDGSAPTGWNSGSTAGYTSIDLRGKKCTYEAGYL